jgi:hypothetical protein
MRNLFVISLWVLSTFTPLHRVAAQTKLDRIFQANMINAQVAYLESIAGPAMHIYPDVKDGQTREYLVNGCNIVAHVSNASGVVAVQSYTLTLAQRCNFNLQAFNLPNLSTRGLTIAKVPFYQSLLFQSYCIESCGNAADPEVDFIQESSHATNWIAVVYTIVLVEMPAIRASQSLDDLMKARDGRDYVVSTKFNCDRKYSSVAAGLFANVPINKVTIGMNADNTGRCQ